MKSSQYNIFINIPNSKTTLLFNTLYGSLVSMEIDEAVFIKKILNNNQPININNDTHAGLVKQKFIIDDNVNELELIRKRKQEGIRDNNRLDAIIMPTLDCNFACSYCYEEHHQSQMTKETEDAVKEWLRKEIPRHKVLLLSWFGGEPLLSISTILSISRHALKVAQDNNVEMIGHITTNGYLFTKRSIRELFETEIFDYQITLDGTPEEHNRLRPLKTGKGTFNRIFNNIVSIASLGEHVRVSIRVNFNHQNIRTIPSLLRMFPENIRSNLRIEFEPIFGDCKLNALDNIQSSEISDLLAQYCTLAKNLGYGVYHGLSHISTGKLVYCYAERENQFVINYNGDVYKCSVTKFKPEDRTGYISNDGTLVKIENEWSKYVNSELFEERCCSCIYLPLCMGGCKSARIESKNVGSYCSLIPTNATYLLKQLALGGFENFFINERI
jgi:uncharacterized protein